MKFLANSVLAVAALATGAFAAPSNLEARGVGRMVYNIFTTVPQGMTFTLTARKGSKGDVGKFYDNIDDSKLPLTVDPTKQKGKLGEFTLMQDPSGVFAGLFSGGNGGSYTLDFTISGKGPKGNDASRTGHLTIQTSEWGRFGRPDNSYLTYVFDGSAGATFSMPTPDLVSLHDIHLDFVFDKDSGALAMGVTDDAPLTIKIAEAAIEGIFVAHEKAISWAVGKAW